MALFNVSTNYEQFLAATLVPALIHILAMTAGAWSVGRELREHTLGEWLSPDGQSASLARVAAVLLGKLLLPAVLALSAITYHLIERPFLALRGGYLS